MESFQTMNLPAELEKALSDLKFINPTEIQSAVIPVALLGCDLMACAETGSGKTAAYGIPIVLQLLKNLEKQALILAPTRELVHQIAEVFRKLTEHCNYIRVTSIVGGTDIRKQLKVLKKKPRIIVATPGRLMDHIRRKSFTIDSIKILVLDEGDRMLDMGFAPQLDEILKYLPKARQTSLYTATLPKKVRSLAEKYLTNPRQIDVGQASQPVSAIQQSVIQVSVQDKNERIISELTEREGSVIVFSRTKYRTDILAKRLLKKGFTVDTIHSGRTQGQRSRALENFKKGVSRILCATDIAARGIDIPYVAHIVNFDLPVMEEDYVHRIGRTARNGATGEAVSFVTPEDHENWKFLVQKYNIQGVELNDSSNTRVELNDSVTYKTGLSRGLSYNGRKHKFQPKKKPSRSFKSKKHQSYFSRRKATRAL